MSTESLHPEQHLPIRARFHDALQHSEIRVLEGLVSMFQTPEPENDGETGRLHPFEEFEQRRKA